jgi:hypothetical protein
MPPINKPKKKRVVQRDVAKRWTPVLARLGWTPVSDFFIDNFHRLDPAIRHGEAMLVIVLMRHKWDDDPPFPGFKSVGKRLGISVTAARQLARSLEKKGYLIREKKIGTTNRFHLQPLFRALEDLHEKDRAKKTVETAEPGSPDLLASFMHAWVRLEQTAGEVARLANRMAGGHAVLHRNPFLAISMLASLGVISASVYEEIDHVRRVRDAVTHGTTEFKKSITPELIGRVETIIRKLEDHKAVILHERQMREAKART